ncbi:hypothetical protein [Halalkalibacter krulwichiae]|uniref:DUF4352 domain-containing protein n=1 Tax=Halalkalibacter krulwichiae TaxID=199441 RepID=A0A1X9MI54_9BACI|nr:hypothetical protein [Halalkalibacter krulwichiae]ARK32320.1 hypothetical protein BkAM31D_22050 [Halalkalibacter krulwichiae]
MTNQPWEIENIQNTVKYLTNGKLILTDPEAEICLVFLEKEGEEINAIVEAKYYFEPESKTYEGLLMFSDYRIVFFSRIADGEDELDYLQTYEYPFISHASSTFETDSHSKLSLDFKSRKQETVHFTNIDRSKIETLVRMTNHFAQTRTRKDYKQNQKGSSWVGKLFGAVVAALLFFGIIGYFTVDEYSEEYEVVDVFDEYDEYDNDWVQLDFEIAIDDQRITVPDMFEYTMHDSYFTNVIEPENYHGEYPSIFYKTSQDNTIYYVFEFTVKNLTDDPLDLIMDVPIGFTLLEDGFYEFFASTVYVNDDRSDFDFSRELDGGEEKEMYIYFEVPPKLKDDDNRLDLQIENFHDYEDRQLIHLR